MKTPKSGGGWKAVGYTLRLANRVGWWRMWEVHPLEEHLQDVHSAEWGGNSAEW